MSLDGRHDREPEFEELYRLMYEATRPGGPASVSLTTMTRFLYSQGVRVASGEIERADVAEAALKVADRQFTKLKESSGKADAARIDAEAKIAGVERLHYPVENVLHATPERVCAHRYCKDDSDDQSEWPCATAVALGHSTNHTDGSTT